MTNTTTGTKGTTERWTVTEAKNDVAQLDLSAPDFVLRYFIDYFEMKGAELLREEDSAADIYTDAADSAQRTLDARRAGRKAAGR